MLMIDLAVFLLSSLVHTSSSSSLFVFQKFCDRPVKNLAKDPWIELFLSNLSRNYPLGLGCLTKLTIGQRFRFHAVRQ